MIKDQSAIYDIARRHKDEFTREAAVRKLEDAVILSEIIELDFSWRV